MTPIPLKTYLMRLYEGATPFSIRFRYGMLAFDLGVLLFIVASSFFKGAPVVEALDIIIGLLLLTDFSARLYIAPSRLRMLGSPFSIIELVVIGSLLVPVAGEHFGFLRILRSLMLLRSYPVLKQLKRDSVFFQRHQDIFYSTVNLITFIFVMTAIVYELQSGRNPAIHNYVDALYYTVTTLTTTGFGDITLQGTFGRLLSVIIMICGVSLFLRLVQTVLRPIKVRFMCDRCGLYMHDIDAVHCKHCGKVLAIPNEGVL